MNKDESRAYARGYNAGVSGRWPAHKPPTPPDERMAAMLRAARALRDAVDSGCATFSEDDEFVLALDPHIEAFDEEMERWSAWLAAHPQDKAQPHDPR